MYYAAYKGESDITTFKTEKERDDWVNFKDEFSRAFNLNEDNCIFERMSITAEEAELRIKTLLHMDDEFNAGQEWYIAF